ncbi:hypothetical protein BHE74_00059235, partial [Ensete ventricosum]
KTLPLPLVVAAIAPVKVAVLHGVSGHPYSKRRYPWTTPLASGRALPIPTDVAPTGGSCARKQRPPAADGYPYGLATDDCPLQVALAAAWL